MIDLQLIRGVSLSLKKEEKYTKMIFDTLLERQSIAINNAKQRLKIHSNFHNSEKNNPSTSVHNL